MKGSNKTKGKNNVSTGIMGEEESFDNRPNKNLDNLKKMQKPPLKEEPLRPVYLVSRLPQACPISYNGETIMVPPRCGAGSCYVADSRKLGKLPGGIRKVPAPEKMKLKMKKKDGNK